ncbi:MAG: 2-C-methyl-D-erythritol 4-phosphate cytidylyltransferase [Dictyoglomaceae bacterium]|nr:2-C-methyl-D-erythritol 4-phosphate cytidylyltransferase [Dictyoglomaceae bacterium]
MVNKILGIILAAGKGKRFGKDNKLLQDLMGKPVIYYSIYILEKVSEIDNIVIVSDREKKDLLEELIKEWRFKKVKDIIEGGKERQDSVYNALKFFSFYNYVLIHDGARPFITEKLVKKIIQEGIEKKAVISGIPVKDTIKLISSMKVEKTLPREKLWQIQTPQFFEYSLILKAHEKAREDNFYGTDDGVLVERLNYPVYIIEGEPWNIKITTKEDLDLAQWLMEKKF